MEKEPAELLGAHPVTGSFPKDWMLGQALAGAGEERCLLPVQNAASQNPWSLASSFLALTI